MSLKNSPRFYVPRLAACALLALACGGNDSPTEPESIAGTYSLTTVNGSPLPVTLLSVPGYTLRVTGGNLVINTNNTFSAQTQFQETEGSQTTPSTETCTGTYTRNGNNLALAAVQSGETCGGTVNATWNGSNRITVAYDASLTAVYTK